MQKVFTSLFLVFCVGAVHAATFTSASSGAYNVPGNWSQVGSDADGIPDQDDDVVISGHSISLSTNASCRNLTINGGGNVTMNGWTMLNWGSLTQNGTITGIGAWQFRATGTYTGNPLNFQGNVYFYSTYTIGTGVSITKNSGGVIVGANCTVTNRGTVTLNQATSGYVQFTNAGSVWVNAANSTLAVSEDFVGSGVLTATAVPNTVHYKNNTANSIKSTTYHHLTFSGASAHTKALLGNITVNGNLTIGSGVTFNWSNFSVSLGGNWINNANINCPNQNTLTFIGSGTQTITRATGNIENFNNVNLSGSGTVLLQDSMRVIGSLDISSGTLDVNTNNFTIRCFGTFNDNSNFNARQGTVFMVGGVAQTIDGLSSTTFYNLTCNNASGVTVNFTKRLLNILNVQAGAFGPSGFGAFVLVASGNTTCARIAPLGATASLTGTSWSIQTFINGPATAYWQYLGSPVQTSTLQDWDGDTRFYMSGVGGNDGNACCPVFRSVRTYNTASNTYTNITSVSSPLTPILGYMVWMSDNMTGLTSPLIYDTRGTPNNGNVSRAVVAGGAGAGYNLVANPMPCPVTFSSVVAASSATLSPNFVILQENGSYATNPNSGTIATGQGFMCVATTSGNITFTEACKSLTANPNVIRQIGGNEIRIKAGNQVNGLGEETVVKLLPGADQRLDYATDLPYLASPYDNATHIWTQNDNGEQFLLNATGTETDHLMIPVNVTSSTPGIQTLTFKDLNSVTEYNCAWLEDLATGQRINLNADDTYEYDEAEMGSTRNFVLHLERNSNCSFDLQAATASLDAQTNVFVSGNQVFAQFEFETEQVVTVSMYDLSGRMVTGETTMNVGTQTIALENPDAHGIYLVRIQSGSEVSTKKIYY